MRELKSASPSRWVELEIAYVGEGMHEISFHYILKNNKHITYQVAEYKLFEYLRRQLGICPGPDGRSLTPLGLVSAKIEQVIVPFKIVSTN